MFVEGFAFFNQNEVWFILTIGASVVVIDALSVDFDVVVVCEIYHDLVAGQLVANFQRSNWDWFVIGSILNGEAVS